MFNPRLMAAQAELSVAKTARDNAPARAPLFLAAALALRDMFENAPKLETFVLTVMLKLEDTLEGAERVVKHRQHLKLVAAGCPALHSADDKASFYFTNMPFWLLGDGSFRLERDNAFLQDLLATEPGSDAECVSAFAVALEMDRSFQKVRSDHYVGELL